MSAALSFDGGDTDVSGFIASHGSDGTPSSHGKIAIASKGEALVDRIMDASGKVFDGYAYALVGGLMWVPMVDIPTSKDRGFALTVAEGAEILADYGLIVAARVPGSP